MHEIAERRFKRPESVLVVVYTRTGKALLLRRADAPDFWQSVTGSLEWGDEQAVETAARELREETGIRVAPGDLIDWKIQQRYEILDRFRFRYAPDVRENVEHFFSIELEDERPVTISPTEHLEFAWVPIEHAVDKVFSWTNREALQHLLKHRPAARSA